MKFTSLYLAIGATLIAILSSYGSSDMFAATLQDIYLGNGSKSISPAYQMNNPGPKINHMSCNRNVSTPIPTGSIGCYGAQDNSNEFGGDEYQCLRLGMTVLTGCEIQTKVCKDGYARATKVYDNFVVIMGTGETIEIANIFKTSFHAVRANLQFAWEYTCSDGKDKYSDAEVNGFVYAIYGGPRGGAVTQEKVDDSTYENRVYLEIPKQVEGKTLILSSYEAVNWMVRNPNNVKPLKVMLISRSTSGIKTTDGKNLPANIEVLSYEKWVTDMQESSRSKKYTENESQLMRRQGSAPSAPITSKREILNSDFMLYLENRGVKINTNSILYMELSLGGKMSTMTEEQKKNSPFLKPSVVIEGGPSAGDTETDVGPKFNAMDCSTVTRRGLKNGESACYGILQNIGNEFGTPAASPGSCYGNPLNKNTSMNASVPALGCTFETPICESGLAVATDMYRYENSGFMGPIIAANLKSTERAFAKHITRIWDITCQPRGTYSIFFRDYTDAQKATMGLPLGTPSWVSTLTPGIPRIFPENQSSTTQAPASTVQTPSTTTPTPLVTKAPVATTTVASPTTTTITPSLSSTGTRSSLGILTIVYMKNSGSTSPKDRIIKNVTLSASEKFCLSTVTRYPKLIESCNWNDTVIYSSKGASVDPISPSTTTQTQSTSSSTTLSSADKKIADRAINSTIMRTNSVSQAERNAYIDVYIQRLIAMKTTDSAAEARKQYMIEALSKLKAGK